MQGHQGHGPLAPAEHQKKPTLNIWGAVHTMFFFSYYIQRTIYIVELRTPAMPVGVGGGKERGGFHLNLRT